jgi:hypothetical protein
MPDLCTSYGFVPHIMKAYKTIIFPVVWNLVSVWNNIALYLEYFYLYSSSYFNYILVFYEDYIAVGPKMSESFHAFRES